MSHTDYDSHMTAALSRKPEIMPQAVNVKPRKHSDMQHMLTIKESHPLVNNRISFGHSVHSGASTKGSDKKSSYHDSPEDMRHQTPYQNEEENLFHEINSASPDHETQGSHAMNF